MKNCYVCDVPLTQNTRFEHVIQDAIGGFLKSRCLLCDECNQSFEEIDCELSEQLKFFTGAFAVKRDGGGKPSAFPTSDGKGYITGGEFVYHKPMRQEREIKRTDEGAVIYRLATKQSSQKTNDVLKGERRFLKKEGVPDKIIDQVIEEARSKIATSIELGDTGLAFVFGGNALRAVAKIATNFYILKGGNAQQIKHLFPYIKDGTESNCIYWFYPEDDVVSKKDEEVLHSIILVGDRRERLLYAYIELFSFYQCIVLLNTDYEGDCFLES